MLETRRPFRALLYEENTCNLEFDLDVLLEEEHVEFKGYIPNEIYLL